MSQFSVISLKGQEICESSCQNIEECLPYLEAENPVWIHITGKEVKETVSRLCDHLKWHALLKEDITTRVQRPKLDDYTHYIYFVMRMLRIDATNKFIESEQVSIVFSSNYLISFSETDCLYKEIKKDVYLLKKGTDYLSYILGDSMIDHYFTVIEWLDKQLEHLERRLLIESSPSMLKEIQKMKREVNVLRRYVWPLREVVHFFQRSESPLIKAKTKIYLNDIYDHTIEAIESVDGLRDLADDMIEIYLTSVDQRTNQILAILTIAATIFVPLTFIASVFGMNFKHMPLLDSVWGFPVVMIGMLMISLAMVAFFYKKRWF